jgi:hypothetical protein
VYSSSPKNHVNPVGLFVDLSVKATVSGAGPEVGVPVKSATGVAAETEDIRIKIPITKKP